MAGYIKTTKFPFTRKYGTKACWGWYEFLVYRCGFKKSDAKKASIRQAYKLYYNPPKQKKAIQLELKL